jgi:hypothetical protein
MPWGSKLAVTLAHPYILTHHPSFSTYLLPYDWKKKEGRKTEKVRKKGDRKKYQDLEDFAFPSSLSHGRAGLDSFHHYNRPPAKTREA